jgi:hypothetical protein
LHHPARDGDPVREFFHSDFAQGSNRLSLQLQVPGQPGLVQTVPAAEVLGWLDGTDPASGFASSFALGSGEHGIGIWLGDDALVCTYHRTWARPPSTTSCCSGLAPARRADPCGVTALLTMVTGF